MITPEHAARMMREIEKTIFDEETAHVDADNLFCEILRELGYTEAVEIFERMPKWYA